MTQEGYRLQFREAKPETDECPHQFIVRLTYYFQKWVELLEFEDIIELLDADQFLDRCSKHLVAHLKIQGSMRLADLTAHGKELANGSNGGTKSSEQGAEKHSGDLSVLRGRICRCWGISHPSAGIAINPISRKAANASDAGFQATWQGRVGTRSSRGPERPERGSGG